MGPPPGPSPGPSACPEAAFQDESRPGLGFTGPAPPGLVCSEWNSVTGSNVNLSQLEQAGSGWGWGVLHPHFPHPPHPPGERPQGRTCLLSPSALANDSHILLCSWTSPTSPPSPGLPLILSLRGLCLLWGAGPLEGGRAPSLPWRRWDVVFNVCLFLSPGLPPLSPLLGLDLPSPPLACLAA